MSGPLSTALTVTKLPAQDLDRARAFYRDKLGLEPVEERTGGLRYVCGPTEFHLFSSAGAPSGKSTQMAFEVENLEATLADLRARGVAFERFEMPGFDVRGGAIVAPDNYPSKGTGELGTFFYDSEGDLVEMTQPLHEGGNPDVAGAVRGAHQRGAGPVERRLRASLVRTWSLSVRYWSARRPALRSDGRLATRDGWMISPARNCSSVRSISCPSGSRFQ